jgi:hypothetical protein
MIGEQVLSTHSDGNIDSFQCGNYSISPSLNKNSRSCLLSMSGTSMSCPLVF